MRCLLCKSAMENKCTNYILDLGNRIIVIHNVPCKYVPNAVRNHIHLMFPFVFKN